MERPVDGLQELGRAVAEIQDREIERVELDTAERLLAAPPVRRRYRRRWVALSFAAGLVALLALVLWWPRSLTFEIGPDSTAGRIDEWIEAPADEPLALRFSDHTVMTLAQGTQVRVIATERAGAELIVERGRVDAAVVSRAGSRWRLRFGPYVVKVTGTQFTAAWDPLTKRLTVELTEGSVQVTGPALGDGQPVVAGRRLVASAAEGRFALSSTAEDPPPQAPGASVPSAAEDGDGGASGSEPALTPTADPSVAVVQAPIMPAWRRLYHAGKFREALGAARSEGFEGLCQQVGPDDLQVLADTARQGGDSGLAQHALTTMRARYPRDARAAVAAFTLGSMAFDQQGAYGQAATWFATYLAEQPGGALAREAAGRLMEAKARAGDEPGARAAATQYLTSHPKGPHADRARKLLAEQPADSPSR